MNKKSDKNKTTGHTNNKTQKKLDYKASYV